MVNCKETEEALALYAKAKERLNQGGFTLRKWKRKNVELAKKIKQRVHGIDPKTEQQLYTKETLGAQIAKKGKPRFLD